MTACRYMVATGWGSLLLQPGSSIQGTAVNQFDTEHCKSKVRRLVTALSSAGNVLDSHDPENRNAMECSDGVAASSPGKASSYLNAMKGEALRGLACHAWLRLNRTDPICALRSGHRESCRFHQLNRVEEVLNRLRYQMVPGSTREFIA